MIGAIGDCAVGNRQSIELFNNRLPSFLCSCLTKKVSAVQSCLLLGIGLQHKSIEDLEKELDIPASQLLGLFNRLDTLTLGRPRYLLIRFVISLYAKKKIGSECLYHVAFCIILYDFVCCLSD